MMPWRRAARRRAAVLHYARNLESRQAMVDDALSMALDAVRRIGQPPDPSEDMQRISQARINRIETACKSVAIAQHHAYGASAMMSMMMKHLDPDPPQ